jgi:hypothetical protein
LAVLAAPEAVVGRPFLPDFGPIPEREMVDSRSEYLYNGAGGPGVRKRALVSDMFCCIAARLTDRWRDHATRPRQSRTLIAMNPRIAPTAMKTVPSGRLLVCINGAFEVGGTLTVTGWTAPDSLGSPVGSAPSVVAVVPVIAGTEADVVVVLSDPVITAVVFAVVVALLVFAVVDAELDDAVFAVLAALVD